MSGADMPDIPTTWHPDFSSPRVVLLQHFLGRNTPMFRHALRSLACFAILALGLAPAASARSTPVDVDALVPPPPPGAACAAVGNEALRVRTPSSGPVRLRSRAGLRRPLRHGLRDQRRPPRRNPPGIAVASSSSATWTRDLAGFWSVDPSVTTSDVRLFAAWASTSTWIVPRRRLDRPGAPFRECWVG